MAHNARMSTAETVSFAVDVRPLFRESDRQAMIHAFDLWDYDDVTEHADAILERLQDGSMPCDAPWAEEQVELFERWIESGLTE
jgi:hypothetical protein